MTGAFSLATSPHLHFGTGKVTMLPSLAASFGRRMLLVTGAHSFLASQTGAEVLSSLEKPGETGICVIDREPSPTMIDQAVEKFQSSNFDVVIAIGGGSVLDAGKAISAMLPLRKPVKDFLEGVGTAIHPGVKVPFIAVPTTSGTGSEATKNAVLSETGENGFKRSLRHNNFVPDIAIIDPLLTITCPASTTAASGMDAFTQLLESYLSTASNPVTDALALEGLGAVARSLRIAFRDGSDVNARSDMALAAYLSGITLANAGLGLVHGFAASIGGFYDAPHGAICSTMMPACNQITVRKLRQTGQNPEALRKYAVAGRLFSATAEKPDDYYCDALLEVIEAFRDEMRIPTLSEMGVQPDAYTKIVAATENKNNPIPLNKDEIAEAIELSA